MLLLKGTNTNAENHWMFFSSTHVCSSSSLSCSSVVLASTAAALHPLSSNHCQVCQVSLPVPQTLLLCFWSCGTAHRLDTVALLHTCFPRFQTCHVRLTIFPGSRCARKQSCICHGSGASVSDVTSGISREPRCQARHCGSSSNSSSSRIVSRLGHSSRLRSISAAVETGSYRCNATVESRNE